MFVALAFGKAQAQSIFYAPDTVCVRQDITLYPKDTTANSYYWSFCAGFMVNPPSGALLGTSFGIKDATDIEIGKDKDGNFYGFYINRKNAEFVRLNYGKSLTNIPTTKSFGNLAGSLDTNANSLFLTKDKADNFILFVVGGSDAATSFLLRLDYGTSLNNNPNVANMGNIDGLLAVPKGFFVAKEGPYWFGFTVNALNGKMIRFDFGTNISNTPNTVDLGNFGGALGNPSDMAAVRDNLGDWHVFATNFTASNVVHVGFGSSLASIPTASMLPVDLSTLYNPSSIIIAKDCGVDYLFITNAAHNNIVRLAFTNLPLLTFDEQSYDFVPGLKSTIAISHFIRDKDNLYAFTVNSDGSMGRIGYENCTTTNFVNSEDQYPPTYKYFQTGRYNIFLSINEGTPEMQMECHTIDVLPTPAITIVDDTTICQNDSASLWAIAFGTDTLRWMPNYNNTKTITTTDYALFTKVYPEYSKPYHFIASYPNGCVVDSVINVFVNKVESDAGNDRTIADGATTILGGPMNTKGADFRYEWIPRNFLDNNLSANPIASPFYDMTYVLKTTNVQGCIAYDTVLVKVACEDVNLPNAFTPEQHTSNNDFFGLKNKSVVQLNYFRIFDRWGNKVFETKDISEVWNGQFNGIDCPYGVYAWVVDGFCSSGKHISKSGNVTLIR